MEKDSEVTVDGKLTMNQQCGLVNQKAKSIMGYIQRIVASRLKEVIFPLYFVLVRPYLEYCIQLWGPQYKKGMDLLEWVQRRPQRQLECWSISPVRTG